MSLAEEKAYYKKYYTGMNSPSAGATLPELTGTGPEGPWRLSLADSNKRMAILFFASDCRAWEQNWAAWNKLLNNRDISSRFLLVATTERVPIQYLDAHKVGGKRVFIGLDKRWQALYRLAATPQTIVEYRGTVQKPWLGVLSDSDVQEIESALKQRGQ